MALSTPEGPLRGEVISSVDPEGTPSGKHSLALTLSTPEGTLSEEKMTRARLTGRTLGRYHPIISSATVPSVLGPVDGEALGFVLPHEHLTVDNRVHHAPRPGLAADARVGMDTLGEVRVWPRALADNIVLDDDTAVLADLRAYRAAGGRTLVEVTPIGMGRDLDRLRRFAQASGVHVVASTAYYVQRGHGDRVAAAPPNISPQSSSTI